MTNLESLGQTEITGDGRFLLIGLGTYEGEGVTLQRFLTYEEANAVAVNYHGPTHYIFEVARECPVDPSIGPPAPIIPVPVVGSAG